MIHTEPSYFKNFACLQDKCPMTCCAGWEITVDRETAESWQQLPAPYAKNAASSVKNGVFQMKDNACVHLENGLCKIHTELGECHTPLTCRRFPVFHHDYGGRIEKGLCFSCPAAAKLIFDAPCTLVQCMTDELPAPNDIDPEQFLRLLQQRSTLLQLCQGNADKRELLTAIYSTMPGTPADTGQSAQAALHTLLSALQTLDFSPQNRRILLGDRPSLPTVEFRKLCFYYLFRYFLLPALGECSETAMLRFLLIQLIGCDLAGRENAPAWAKETEHCDENLRRLRSDEKPFVSKGTLQSIIAAYPSEYV